MIGNLYDIMIVASPVIVVFILQSIAVRKALGTVVSLLKRQQFMIYDVPTAKGFPILPEVSLRFLAQGRIVVLPSAQKSQNNLNVSHITF